MATRTRTLPSWLTNIGEANPGKEKSSASQRGKQQAKRTVNKTPKKETPARGKTVKTSPDKNLAFSESEGEDSRDTATSAKRRKEDKYSGSKLKGQKPAFISDSENELVKKTADKVMVSNGLHEVSRGSPASAEKSKEKNNVNTKLAACKPLAISDSEEEADTTPKAVGSMEDRDGLLPAGGFSSQKFSPVSDENEWNQFEIKSSPIHEDGSDAEDTAAAESRAGDVNSSNKTDTVDGDGSKENSDGGNTSTNQAADDTDTNTPSRPPCNYGSSCYRRNPQHLQNFSHPGDADYSTTDNRPECEYGTACYRKNPLHRQNYKHTKTPPVQNANQTKRKKPRRRGSNNDDGDTDSDDQGSSRRGPKKRQTKPRKATNRDDDKEEEEEEDDYDFEDPFLNDGSSDDYAPTVSGSETDFSAAESGSGEEEEDTKRTKKEAKKFLRQKK